MIPKTSIPLIIAIIITAFLDLKHVTHVSSDTWTDYRICDSDAIVDIYSVNHLTGVVVVREGLHSHVALVGSSTLRELENTIASSKFRNMPEINEPSDPRFGANDSERVSVTHWNEQGQHKVTRTLGNDEAVASIAHLIYSIAGVTHKPPC